MDRTKDKKPPLEEQDRDPSEEDGDEAQMEVFLDLSDEGEDEAPEEPEKEAEEEAREEKEIRAAEGISDVEREILAEIDQLENAAREMKDPAKQARCLLEAGRLHERRLSDPESAGRCYAEALAMDPGLGLAGEGLRRARLRGADIDAARKGVEASIDSGIGGAERSASLLDLAMLQGMSGDTESAAQSLESAASAEPLNLGALLKAARLALARREVDTFLDHLIRISRASDSRGDATLSAFAAWTGAARGRGAIEAPDKTAWTGLESLLAACAFGRLGDLENAAAAIDPGASDKDAGLQAPMLRLKAAILSQGLDRTDEALGVLDGCDRILCLALVNALSPGAHKPSTEASAVDSILSGMEDPVFRKVLETEKAFMRWSAGDREAALGLLSRYEAEAQQAWFTGALVGLVGGGATLGAKGKEDPCSALGMMEAGLMTADEAEQVLDPLDSKRRAGFDLILAAAHGRSGDWKRLAQALERILKSAGERETAWAAAVALADIGIHRLGEGPRGLDRLKDLAAAPEEPPLGLFLRIAHASSEDRARHFEEEASVEEDPLRKAWLLSLAAILEKTDIGKAGETYGKALETSPLCPPALWGALGILREGDPSRMAVISAAAKSASDPDLKAILHLFEGFEESRNGRVKQALRSIEAALSAWPDERDLERLLRVLDPSTSREKPMPADASLAEAVSWALSSPEERPEGVVHRLSAFLASPSDRALLSSHLEWRCLALGRDPDPEALPRSGGEEFAVPQVLRLFSKGLELLRSPEGLEEAAAVFASAAAAEPESALARAFAALLRLGLDHREDLSDDAVFLAADCQDPADATAWAMLALRLSDRFSESGPQAEQAVRIILEHSPSHLEALRRLEGAARKVRDHSALASLFTKQVDLIKDPLSASLYQARKAEALLAFGDKAGALASFKTSLDAEILSPAVALGFIPLAVAEGRFEEAALVLERLSDSSSVQARKVEDRYRAASIWDGKIRDMTKAADAYRQVLELEPGYAPASRRLVEILKERQDKDGLVDALEHRLTAIKDPAARAGVLWEISRLLCSIGQKGRAKEHLEDLLRIEPSRREAIRMLADLRKQDGEWSQAVEVLSMAARHFQSSKEGADLFFELGEIFIDYLSDPSRAEGCFMRALKLDENHKDAMMRVGWIFEEDGRWSKAVEAFRHCLQLAASAEEKAHWEVEIARVLEQKGGDARSAEETLRQARKRAPASFEPVEALVGFYERQNAPKAKAVSLDRAVADFVLHITEDPLNPRVYHDLFLIHSLRNDTVSARSAAYLVDLLDEADEEERKLLGIEGPWWGPGKELSDPWIDEILSPPVLSAAVRAVLKGIEPYVSKEMGLTVKKLGLSRSERITDPRHPLIETLNQLIPHFKAGEVALYRDPRTAAAAMTPISAQGTSLVFSAALVDRAAREEAPFLVGRGLKILQLGLGLLTGTVEIDLRMLKEALARIVDPKRPVPVAMDKQGLLDLSERLAVVIPDRVLGPVAPFVREWAEADPSESGKLGEAALAAADRAGLIAASSLPAALKGLCLLGGEPLVRGDPASSRKALGSAPRLAHLLAFALGRDISEIRERIGSPFE